MRDTPPAMGSEDFSFMLESVPGCYVHVGNGPSRPVHNPGYEFSDVTLAYGSQLLRTDRGRLVAALVVYRGRCSGSVWVSISSCSAMFQGRLPGEMCRKCRYFSNWSRMSRMISCSL